ncbi:GNAT family N-acetyltransferase [Chromobacterium sp. ASV23]|uniref:GNAT family N-acetyltransferase n=1 Tax=Chromobacterium sp. ASV23 TaxID=2795110 RepID=UPI0018EE08E2|nr:GNAT family N-acetyltransferase [Chromobacterium sp. ASV23]
MQQLDISAIGTAVLSERLCLEPLQAEHATALFPLFQHPRIYDWISIRQPASVEALAKAWRDLPFKAAGEPDEYGFGWAVRRLEDGAWLGKMDADVRADGIASNVGYWFAPDYWGQGYASEAVAALARHLALHGVYEQRATVTVGNEASLRVLARAGFVQTRVLPDNDTVGGRLVDDVELVRFA